MNRIEEHILVLQIRSGKPERFVAIYDQYVRSIFRFIRLKVSSHELAEDLASEVFTKALEYLVTPSRPTVRNVRPFLYQLARAAIANHYRAASVGTAVDPELAEDVASGRSAGELAEQGDTEAALAKLPEDQREAVVLRHLEGLPAGEVAKIMGKSAGAVRVLAHRGLRTLREILGGSGDEVQ